MHFFPLNRCNLGQVVAHISADVLTNIRGTSSYLSLAVTSDQTAQEVLRIINEQSHNLHIIGLCQYLICIAMLIT